MEHLATAGPERARARSRRSDPRAARFDERFGALVRASRLLPALVPLQATERARLLDAFARGLPLVPRWREPALRNFVRAFRTLDALRREAEHRPTPALHLARLDEIELDLRLLEALGRPEEVRALARVRFGSGESLAPTPAGPVRLGTYARSLLDATPPPPAPAPGAEPEVDLGRIVRALARAAGVEARVRVDPTLVAAAASGERTVFVSGKPLALRTALRLGVHEVLGHLVSAENGRRQPLRLLEWGTAGAFVDQEGLALVLEEAHGVFDAGRRRTIAARVLATNFVHAGASFDETVTRLVRDEGFAPAEALVLAERAHRGGGVARDAGYLLGWLRVRDALARGRAELDDLRMGRVSLDALPAIETLVREGLALPAQLRANFSRSFFSTSGGTTPFRLPPSWAASLIRLELT